MESTPGFAYVYSTNAIEIVTKGRIWPRALKYSNFFFKGRRKKNQGLFIQSRELSKQESILAKDMVTKRISLWEVLRMKAGVSEAGTEREKSLIIIIFLLHPCLEFLSNQLETHILTV